MAIDDRFTSVVIDFLADAGGSLSEQDLLARLDNSDIDVLTFTNEQELRARLDNSSSKILIFTDKMRELVKNQLVSRIKHYRTGSDEQVQAAQSTLKVSKDVIGTIANVVRNGDIREGQHHLFDRLNISGEQKVIFGVAMRAMQQEGALTTGNDYCLTRSGGAYYLARHYKPEQAQLN